MQYTINVDAWELRTTHGLIRSAEFRDAMMRATESVVSIVLSAVQEKEKPKKPLPKKKRLQDELGGKKPGRVVRKGFGHGGHAT